ncbi:HAMP domain-containing histidine kinase [Ectothiorhodospiraceae bacterium WFHF3C12]|nr:HAMP domain-containing histidine kinase [Ectothiorhodospiraceae bacterium WFHF3C12]
MPSDPRPPVQSHRLIWQLRWLLAALLLSLAAIVADLPATALAASGGLALIMVNLALPPGRTRRAGNFAVLALLTLDLAALGAGLAASGGVSNPLVGFMMLPVAIGAVSLPRGQSAAIAAAAVTVYGLLGLWHFPLPLATGPLATVFQWHLWGMWASFAVTAALLVASVGWLSRQLSAQRSATAALRDQLTRREAVVAVATEAAVTSHEMGTPLSTAMMLADNLGEPGELPAQATADLNLLRDQLQRCREALGRIRDAADEARERVRKDIPVRDIVEGVRRRFAALNPAQALACEIVGDGGRVVPATEPHALTAALLNLLENQSEAVQGAGTVTLRAVTDATGVDFEVLGREHGTPLPEPARTFPASTKTDGLGVGVLLSHATVEQLGGQLFWGGGRGGDRVRIRMPLETRDPGDD